MNTISSSLTRQKLFDHSFAVPRNRPHSTQINDIKYQNGYSGNKHDGNISGRGRGRYHGRRRKFERKPRNDVANKNQDDASYNDRREWLRKATDEILEREHGTLTKGKWHELVSMMKGWSKLAKIDPESPVIVERLIKRLHDERIAGNDEARADISVYNLLLDAWCCAGLFATNYEQQTQDNESAGLIVSRSSASQRAREILMRLQENYEYTLTQAKNVTKVEEPKSRDDDTYAIKPNEQSFDLVFDVVLKVEGVAAARSLLTWLECVSKSNTNNLAKPSQKHYIRILNAYANSRDKNAGDLAEGILRHMEKIGETPDTVCYNIAIKAWTKAKRGRESAEHADRILEEMKAPKDVITYSTVISGWSASGMQSHAVVRAEELLREMEETPGLEPNTIVLNSVMSAWVKSKNPATVNRTTELLKYMEYSSHAHPDLVTYNTHLHALSTHSHRVPGYAQRATDLLVSLEAKFKRGQIRFRPNLFSYNVVIEAWCKSRSPEAAWNAVKFLRSFISSDSTYEPDTFSFNQVFSALSRSTKPGSAKLAEHLLDYMEIASRTGVFRKAKADLISYSSVIIALAKSGEDDAAERGEILLNRMKEQYEAGRTFMKPTRTIYHALINAWAKSGKGTLGAKKSEALLKEMEELCAMGDVSVAPNIVTYNSVVNSWAQSGALCAGNKAVKYLDRMTIMNGTKGEIEIRPNGRTFNTVINAIAQSDSETKVQKSFNILRRMDELYKSGYRGARPNVITYTNVLNAAAFPANSMDFKTKRKVLDTAIFILNELQTSQYGQPTELTYSTFIKACYNLLPTEDETSLREVIQETFHQCKEDGQVGDMILSRLREVAPEGLYKDLLSEVVVKDIDCVKVDDLPQSWRCNVRSDVKQ